MPTPRTSCNGSIATSGGAVRCPLDPYVVKFEVGSTEESGTVSTTLALYDNKDFDPPSGKDFGADVVYFEPDDLEVDDWVKVNLRHSGISNPKVYGAAGGPDPDPWVELPTQSAIGRSEQQGQWTETADLRYAWFCVAGD